MSLGQRLFLISSYNRSNIEDLQAHLKSLGADHIIIDEELRSYKTKELIKEWTSGNNKIKLGLNCVGGETATEMSKYIE